jgi:hypothetical protein
MFDGIEKMNYNHDNIRNMFGKFKEFDDTYNYPRNKTMKAEFY